jgi:DNA-directed RNA polymerase specialized sigma24 family protein
LASAPELQELAAVLGLLPERLRTPLVLRYLCDLPVGAVADALGWRQAVVEARLGQALARLRGLLEL